MGHAPAVASAQPPQVMIARRYRVERLLGPDGLRTVDALRDGRNLVEQGPLLRRCAGRDFRATASTVEQFA